MPDIFLGEFGTDTNPPVVNTRSPANLATGVLRTANISFNVVDVGGSGVALASISVTVNGVPAVTGGLFQAGFTGTTTPITDGYAVFINPTVNFTYGATKTVVVNAYDLSPIVNIVAPDTWSFTVELDTTPPVFNNLFPANLATGVAFNTNFSFDIADADSPVPQVSINLTLNAANVIVNGVASLGYAVVFTPITGGFTVTVNPAVDLAVNLVVNLAASAKDSASPQNSANAAWSFTTISDTSPPEVSNYAPTGSLVSRTAHITFDLTDPGVEGVNINSVDVIVNGVTAFSLNSPQNGFTATVTPILGGFHFNIAAPSDWALGLTVSVTINASDMAP